MILPLVLLLACGSLPPAALLPDDATPSFPALTRVDVGTDADVLADVQSCAGCHAEQAAQWADSPHALSSFDNPWYRASVQSFRDEAGASKSRMCAGCHDPVLLVAGAMDEEIGPETEHARAGVTCLACHGAVSATPDGNGSVVLGGPVPLPVDGDEDSLEAHRAAVGRPVLREAVLCVACHRGFVSQATGNTALLMGMDEGGPWGGSAWAGSQAAVLEPPVEASSCIDCHMRAGHRFPGGQTALAAQVGAEQQAATVALLEQAVTLDVGAVWLGGLVVPPGQAEVSPGDRLLVDVVVRNVGAGHQFPGGLRDTQDTWLDVAAVDADGAVLAEATSDWVFGALVLDGHGLPETAHRPQRFECGTADATVPPRGARAVRYALEVPADAVLPMQVVVALRHRRHVEAVAEAACEASRAEDWSAAGRPALDGCIEQPVTVLATAGVVLGEGEASFQRGFDHALALSGDVSEHLAEAAAAVETLDALAEGPFADAQVEWLRAVIAGRRGRVDEALAAADRAEALIGAHPALDRARGDALAQVWRWSEAVAPYAAVAEAAPRDTAAWRALARAAGSAGAPELALDAAWRGLALNPRDPALLRSQALALGDLGRRNDAALAAYDAAREPDAASELAATCEREVPGCRTRRLPVPVIDLVER